jgi:predicted DsbA family dithiol-disulfide isomerase
VVAEAGLDRGKAEAMLNGADGLEAIKGADEVSRRFRVEGVPFFIVNGGLTLAGAQPPDRLLEAFRQAVDLK